MIGVGDRSRNLGTLNEEQVERIHAASLRLLASVGVRVRSKRAREVLSAVGGQVQDEVVRLPSQLVTECLALCPRHVTLYACDGGEQMLRSRHMCHSTGCHRLYVLDYGSAQARSPGIEDMRALTRVADALPAIGAVTLMVSAMEHPGPMSALKSLETLVLNTRKHLYLAPQTLLEARVLLDLAEITTGERAHWTPVSLFASATSPLTIGGEVAEILFEAIARGAVLTVGSCAAGGASSPATLAGTILLQNVETLFLLTLAQSIRPGTPVVYDAGSTVADLRTGTFNLGAVEYALITDGAVALVNKYGLPFSTTCDTNSPVIDVQNGLQKMLGYLSMMGTGANLSKNAGSLANGTIMSLEQLVLDNETILLAERFFQGVRVDDESLAEELIAQIGPGGHFLTSQHTLTHCRSGEHYVSPLLNMQAPEKETMLERAHQKAVEIVSRDSYAVDERAREEVRRYVVDLVDTLEIYGKPR